MLKQKPKGTSPLLDKGRPKLETVEVAPVGDILNDLENVQNEYFVNEEMLKIKQMQMLNERRRMEEPRFHGPCSINCPCAPCREGLCGQCFIEVVRSREELEEKNMHWRRNNGIDPYSSGSREREDDEVRYYREARYREQYREARYWEQDRALRYSRLNFGLPYGANVRIPIDAENDEKWKK